MYKILIKQAPRIAVEILHSTKNVLWHLYNVIHPHWCVADWNGKPAWAPNSITKKLYNFITLLLLISFVSSIVLPVSLYSNPLSIPQLNLQGYDETTMNQIYGHSYFLNHQTAWEDQVLYYKGLLKASWEQSADTAINNYVNSITESDAYNDVEAYRDYALTELTSQKQAAYHNWEIDATRHFLENRSEFLTRLTDNMVSQSYLERISAGHLYQQYQQTLSSINSQEQQLVNAANDWNINFNENYQNGLNDFSTALSNIHSEYENFVNSLDASESVFEANLAAIDQYKAAVKTQIGYTVSEFETALNDTCSGPDPCLYRKGDGTLNNAGDLLQNLVTNLKSVLDNDELSPDMMISGISNEIRSFLDTQTGNAWGTYSDWNQRVNTNQTSLSPSTYGVEQSIFESRSWQINNSSSGLTFDSGLVQGKTEWHGDGYSCDGNSIFGICFGNTIRHWFSGVEGEDNKAILQAIKHYIDSHGDETPLINILKDRPEIGGKTVTGISAANIYSSWFGPNGTHHSSAWASTGSGGHTGNYRQGGGWDSWHKTFGGTPFEHNQHGGIGYAIAFTMYDSHADAQSVAWNGHFNSLNNQFNLYNNDIMPAISNWESQVISYNNFYDQWKGEAETLRTEALANRQKALEDLEVRKSVWLNRMQDEYRDGSRQWSELQQSVANARSAEETNRLMEEARSLYTNSLESSAVDTGAKTSLSSFRSGITDLENREFSFAEPVPVMQAGGVGGGFSEPKYASIGSKFDFNTILDGSMISAVGGSGIFKAVGLNEIAKDGLSSAVQPKTKKFNIFTAAQDKKVETSLSINGKDVSEIFQNTANGTYQFAQVLSMNDRNDFFATQAQERFINSQAYGINWDNRVAVSLDANGNVSNPNSRVIT